MRAFRVILAAAAFAAAVVASAVASPGSVRHVAECPDGSVPNAAGYACVNPNPIGAPSQMEVTRCHGNHYFCFWPYD